ncbi:MFS transporter [soil metagenome]
MNKIKKKYLWHLIVSRGLVSFGSALTGFGLDIWVYRLTESYALFASIAALATLPPLIVSPFAGFLADKINKARILTFCEFGTIFLLVVTSVLYKFDQLSAGYVAGAVFGLATISEFRYTAITAIIPSIADKEQLISANGLQQAFRGTTMVCAPFLGAAAYQYLGLGTLLMVSASFGMYAIYASTMLVIETQGPKTPITFSLKAFWSGYVHGFKWLSQQRKLKAIVVHFTTINALIGVSSVLTTTRILDSYSANFLALIASSQGVGMLLIGVFLARAGGRFSAEALLFVGSFFLGTSMLVFGVFNNMPVMAISAFCIGASIAVIAIANQSIWQENTPAEVHGKIIAIRSMALYSFVPATLYVSAPLFPFLKVRLEGVKTAALLSGWSYTWQGVLQVTLALLVMTATVLFFRLSKQTESIAHRGLKNMANENE